MSGRTIGVIPFAASACLFFSSLYGLAGEAQALPETCYLFSSFRDNGTDGLHLAWSADGMKWSALNGDKSFVKPSVGRDKLMRDPSIVQDKSGTFHMVWSSGWWDKGFGYANSKDLINWSEQKFIPVMAHEASARNTWAPDISYDPVKEQYLIQWATTIPGRFPETENSSEDNCNHRMYYVTTKDFQTFSEAKLLFDAGFNCIDGTLIVVNGKAHLIVKNETLKPAQKNLRVAVSGSSEGPFADFSAPFTPNWVEGPSAIKIGDDVVVYFDCYTKGRYGAMRTKDFKQWEDITDKLSFPKGTRHGTVFPVNREILEVLLSHKGN